MIGLLAEAAPASPSASEPTTSPNKTVASGLTHLNLFRRFYFNSDSQSSVPGHIPGRQSLDTHCHPLPPQVPHGVFPRIPRSKLYPLPPHSAHRIFFSPSFIFHFCRPSRWARNLSTCSNSLSRNRSAVHETGQPTSSRRPGWGRKPIGTPSRITGIPDSTPFSVIL